MKWFVYLYSILLAISAYAIIDINGNGLDDVWENYYSATGLVAGADNDFDRLSNLQESIAGTDPLNPDSFLGVSIENTSNGLDVGWSTLLGKEYQLQQIERLESNVWSNAGTSVSGSNDPVIITMPAVTQGFFRVGVTDLDFDLDQLTDWAEHKLAGFSAMDSDSTGTNDFLTLSNALSVAEETVSVEVKDAAAFEDSGTPARFRINRSGPLAPLTVHFSLSGFTNGTRGSASPGDYEVEDSAGSPLGGSVSLPFGALSADIVINPVSDSTNEVPEVVTLTLSTDAAYSVGASNSATVVINDAPDIPENEKLFFAYLGPQPGAQTTASGYSVLYLSGDNSSARITVFPVTSGNLTSEENEKHIHGSGGIIELFTEKEPDGTIRVDTNGQPVAAIGTVVDYEMQIDGMTLTAALTSNQDFLDELIGGSLFVNVHTAVYPGGEVKGFYNRQTGSTELVVPADPPAIPTLTGTNLTRDVARFLTQATFGPTAETISNLVYSVTNTYGGDQMAAYTNWIDSQFALDQTRIYDFTYAADNQEWELRGYGAYTNTLFPPYPTTDGRGHPFHNNRRRGHWLAMIKAHDQLRQRLAFAWSQIMVVSEADSIVETRHYGAAKYFDMLGENADDTYRDMLAEVSYHPIMGSYLSHLQNQKAVTNGMGDVLISPDENYAREIMQLFSIGLVKLHLDGSLKLSTNGLPIITYDNNDITEMARIFTGLSFSKYADVDAGTNNYVLLDNTDFNLDPGNKFYSQTYEHPMKMFGAFHDDGAKLILDDVTVDNTFTNDLDVLGRLDVEAAIDALANHSNTGPFIARRLIQRLVTSNPSAGYIYRVAKVFEDNGSGVRGDLKAVTKAILLDYEARSLDVIETVGYGKQKEPIIRYIALLRAFDAQSQIPLDDLADFGYPTNQLDNFPAGTTRYRYGPTDYHLSQTPLGPPSVFNWFLPDYTPAGDIAQAGLKAPEFMITTESTVVTAINYFHTICRKGSQSTSQIIGQTNSLMDNVVIDRDALKQMHDDAITGGATIEEAVTVVVDYCDLLMMSGGFKARYESAAEPNPRSIVIDTAASVSINQRIGSILYLMATCPDYIIQQ